MMDRYRNFAELCAERARTQGDQLAYAYLNPRGGQDTLSFAGLEQAAGALAARLGQLAGSGDRILIICPQSIDYVIAFFGCLYGGLVAVPAYAPRNNHHLERLQSIIDDAQPKVVLLCRKQYASVSAFMQRNPAWGSVQLVVVDDPADTGAQAIDPAWRPASPGREDIAFLQYTSGSTEAPKGIMVSHGNLFANEEMIRRSCGNDARTRAVSWLPLFHDMGLMTLLQGMYVGYPTYLMAPMDFLTNPLLWLQTLSRLKATLTVGPNFAWQLCVDKIEDGQLGDLDLSCLQAAISGSEPIAVRTLDAFAAKFAPCGFTKEAFRPSYGLAEATLLVTGCTRLHAGAIVDPPAAASAPQQKAIQRVSCGLPAPGCEVVIVDPEQRQRCGDGQVGEIWVKGAHVAQGYWRRPQQTAEAFGNHTVDGAGPFLSTGDLGFMHKGELVVTGRSKDLIIIRGDNYYPSDIEASAVAAHPALIADGAAAFVLGTDDGHEQDTGPLCIVAEVRRNADACQYPDISQAIVARISSAFGLAVERVALIKERALPKTSSGKVQRGAVRATLADGQLQVLWQHRAGAAAPAVHAAQGSGVQARLDKRDGAARAQLASGYVLGLLADASKTPFYLIDQSKPLSSLGLDSLALMHIRFTIEATLGATLPADLLFSDMPMNDLLATVAAIVPACPQEETPLAPLPAPVPITPGQAALWLIQQADRGASQYNEGFVAQVDGNFDHNVFSRVLRILEARHDSLRVRFIEVDGEPRACRGCACEQIATSYPDDAQALAAAREALVQPFDLSSATWRCVYAVGPTTAYLALVFHHIAVDMRATEVLVREMQQIYAALVAGNSVPEAFIGRACAHADFANWQRDWLVSPEGRQAQAYWQHQLNGAPQVSTLPASCAPGGAPSAGRHRFVIDAAARDQLHAFARLHGFTAYQVLFGACALLLARYADQDEVVLGMPVLGRSRGADTDTVGYFANVLPIRVALAGQLSPVQWFGKLKETILSGIRHQGVPLPVIKQASAAPANGALVQVVFSLLQASLGDDAALRPFLLGGSGGCLRLGDSVLSCVDPQRRRSQFEMSFILAEDESGLHADIEYRSDLYSEAMIARLAANYRSLLQALVAGADRPLSEIAYVSPEELAAVRADLGSTAGTGLRADGAYGSVVDWFRHAAARHPAKPALSNGKFTFNYEELDRESNVLAQMLLARGITPGACVALLTQDRAWQAAMAIAVLKAGAVYVPIDPANPAERIEFLLRDSGARLLLTTCEEAVNVPVTAAEIHCVDALDDDVRADYQARGIPRVAVAAQQAAYCVYTSGSTGQPKGVLITHGGLMNLVEWHMGAFDVDSSARGALLAGPGFDAAVWESWPYLCAGASLVQPSPHYKRDMRALALWLKRQRITHCFMATPLAESFFAAAPADGATGTLKYLLTGGDQLKMRPRAGSGFQLVNAYGPSENTVVTTSGVVGATGEAAAGGAAHGLPDIGGPIAGQVLQILDSRLGTVPRGVCGELYIGGAGLALGYHANPRQTASRFIPDPHAQGRGARMYGTGDIVRLDESGRLHFVGRNDDQVQVRGVRIEPGEIEAALISHPQVRQSKVIARDGERGRELAAFVTAAPGVTAATLRSYLDSRLPRYMIPAAITLVDALPLDANGKVSRRQLAQWAVAPAGGDGACQPRPEFANEHERALAEIFRELLACEVVGPDDDFFLLGGHSLLVARLAAAIRQRLGVTVSIADIFSYPKVADLALQLSRSEPAAARVSPIARPQHLPLSQEQERLWLLHQLDPGSTDYNICGALRIDGKLDLARLEAALAQVCEKHEVLRTVFARSDDGEPRQVIRPLAAVAVERLALAADAGGGAAGALLDRALAQFEAQPFDLASGPLLRLAFLPVNDAQGYLLLNVHHIVADGRSVGILFEELASFYRGITPGAPAGAPALQYADYALWTRAEANRERQRDSLEFWKEKLGGQVAEQGFAFPAPSGVAATRGHARPAGATGSEVSLDLPASHAELIRSVAARHGVTESVLYMAAFGALVARCSDNPDVLLGMAYARRDLPEFAGQIGLFVNVLPIRLDFDAGNTFRAQLQLLREACVEAYRHADVGYAQIVQQSGVARADGAAELIRTMFDFEQDALAPAALGDTRASPVRRPDRSAKFDLTLRCSPQDGGMRIALNYRTALFSQAAAAGLLDACRVVLEQVAQSADLPLGALQLVGDGQARALLQLGRGEVAPASDISVVGQFERMARTLPQHLAVAGEDGARLSYEALNAQANRVARHLATLGAGAGSPVALCLRPAPSFVIAALALLKLGAPYVPIDPSYPDARKLRIVADSGAALVIGDPDAVPEALPEGCTMLSWDMLAGAAAACGQANPEVGVTPDSLAYIVYTSGTSGTPKGVSIPHRGLANLCQWHARAYGLSGAGARIRASQTAGIGFDAAVWEIWPYLCTGASVWFAPQAVRQSSRLLTGWLTESAITHCFLATPLAHAVIADGWTGSGSLDYLLTGGERLTSHAPEGASYRLVNHYGPSENSVVATAGEVGGAGALPSIGKAIDNVTLYVLDRQGQLLPRYMAGELCIGGASLMREYHANPALTRDRLVDNPYAGEPGARMYRSGDLVRWNEAGTLDYLGRVDEQIKLRGHRIEPSEILAVIKAQPGVYDAVVRAVEYERQGMQLVAYVVFEHGAQGGAAGMAARLAILRAAIAAQLPEFMVPAFMLELDALPLTGNGKVDYAALPLPRPNEGAARVPLGTPTEHALAAIWSELLGETVDSAGANFFALGGHSLLAARAVALIEARLQRALSLMQFFRAPDLAALARQLDEAEAYSVIPHALAGEPIPLSPYQKRLWLMQAFDPASVRYNVVGALRLTGMLDPAAFRTALGEVVERHQVLRSRIVEIDGAPYQQALPAAQVDGEPWPLNLLSMDLCGNPRQVQEAFVKDSLARLANEPFVLASGQLFKLLLIRTAADSAVLAASFHHIVVDAWSAQVFLRDLLECYGSRLAQRTASLPRLPIQYQDYSLWAQRELARSTDEHENFWRGYLAGMPDQGPLPVVRRHAGDAAHSSSTLTIEWPAETLGGLQLLARRQQASLYEVLLTSYLVWLHRLGGQSDFMVGMPFNDRGRPELEDLVGFFVNVLPLRAKVRRHLSFVDLLEQTRQNLRQVYAHHALPFDRIAEACSESDGELFQTMFDFQSVPLRHEHGAGGAPMRAEVIEGGPETAVAALSVTFRESGEGLALSCTYVNEQFGPQAVAGWLENFRLLVDSIASHGERHIGELAFLTPAELDVVARLGNRAAPDGRRGAAPNDRPGDMAAVAPLLHELVEHRARLSPSAPSLVWAHGTLSYAELARKTNQLAACLLAAGVRPGMVVAVEAVHCAEAVMAIVACGKAGAICFPLDLTLPPARIALLLADSGSRHVLTLAEHPLEGFDGRRLALAQPAWSHYPDLPPDVDVTPDYGVFLTYTSGTSGRPKASVLHHRGIVNYVATVVERFGYRPADRGMLFAPLTFDAALEEIFAPLYAGASLYLGEEGARDSVSGLLETCRRHLVTILTLPTAYWRILSEHLATLDPAGAAWNPVRLVSIGGERATIEAVLLWQQATAGKVELFNIYGPSECSIGSIVDRVDPARARRDGDVYLLRPVANVSLHVLDEYMHPVPTGLSGELYIGGAGVAQGYHRSPALTAQRFVPDPFSASEGARMYRSGDLVRYDLEGQLRFLGRADFQVKVDGIRVEPEEVQLLLESHPGVAQAVVLAVEGKQARNPLVAYVTLSRSGAGQLAATGTDGAPFVDYLRERLPAHMVPARVVVMDAFPLTTNQKVDRRALLQAANDPQGAPVAQDAPVAQAAPALTPTETALLAVWRELLGEADCGPDDNFFALGGSSLLAIRINNRIETAYGVRLPVAALFESPTVRELALLVERMRAGDGTHAPESHATPVRRVEASVLPLSGAQYRLWYLDQLNPDSTAYNLPDLIRLEGALDHAALCKALEYTMLEHESLRTRFVVEAETPMQVIGEHAAVPLRHEDLSQLAPEAAQQALQALLRRLVGQKLDLKAEPLAFTLVKVAGDTHVLVSIFHHAIIDGWSVGLFQQSLARHYNLARRAAPPVLPPLAGPGRALQYRDFAVWQRELMDGGERARQAAYWRDQLGGLLPALQLPTDFARPAQPSGNGKAFTFELDEELSARLRALAEGRQVSMFMLLIAAYALLLSRYARQEDILIGMPALGRGRPELETIVGFFVNTLVMRVRPRADLSFGTLVEQVRQTSLEAFAHQDLPLEEIAAELDVQRERDGSGLFQTMFSYQEGDALASPHFDGLTASSIEPEHRTAKFDLYLAVWPEGQRLRCGFEFLVDLFEEATVRRMAGHYRNLLGAIVASPDSTLRALPLLSTDEIAHQVHALNRTTLAFAGPRYARDVFAESVALHPGRVAASCGAQSMTYAQLDRAAQGVANQLLARGARGEDLVGLFMGRGLDYLVAMLGALKAGLPFTPLNPEDPVYKVDRIVERGQVRYLVHNADSREQALALAPRAVRCELDALLQDLDGPAPAALALTPSSLAYVIYTSGSTGEPKGAMIEQQGMLNHLRAKIHDLGIDGTDVIAEMAVNTFDVSVWQYLLALLVGGRTAVIPGDAAWEPQQLLSRLDAERVTVFESVPSHMKILIDELEAAPGSYRLDQLRMYVSNAEALTPALCARWFACLPEVPIVNTYGATECSDDTSHLWVRPPVACEFPYVPIQGTLPNLRTYLLDAQMQPVPRGVVGEVYLGGVGVGRGYLGDPVRTASAFVPDPFSDEVGRRLYRTGDLARYRPGDVLEFVGREDFQVKIRGQRVEIGEIEKAIGEHDNVRQAVVVAAQDAKQRLFLLGFVIPHRHPAPTVAELRSFVGRRVAGYMVPASFVLMDEFPLNANGKVDRKRLPQPADQEIFNRHAYVAPRTATEEKLALLWQEQLDVEQVGALDSFLELGGHSLLVAEMMLRIRTLFGVALPMRTLFQTPQLHAVAAAIDALGTTADSGAVARIAPGPARAHYPLAPCQVPEWYAYQMDPTSPVYNISVADLFFTGKLDKDAFLSAWNTILERHQLLRAKFDYRDGAPVQLVDPAICLRAADVFLDRSALGGADAIDEANVLAARFGTAPFDFANGPLFRLHLVSYGGDFHQMIFVVHHIIWDETSLINMMLELSELYNAGLARRQPVLPAVEVSYFDYVEWMHAQLRSGAFDRHKQYWLDMYRELPPPLDLPTDYPRPNLMSYRGDAVRTWLPRSVVRKIEAFLKKNDVTLFMLQLAVLDFYLYRMSGQNDFVIGCPIAGRSDESLKPLLGLFATPMPLRCTIDPAMSFSGLLAQVSQRALEGFEHYHYPSNMLIEQLQHEKDLSRPKLFSIMYGVQNNKTDLMGRLQFDGLALSLQNVVDTENRTSRFDLNFVVDQFGSDIMFSCIYNTDLFHSSSVESMLRNMTVLMDQVLSDPGQPLHSYTMVEAGGAGAALHGPRFAYDAGSTMHAMMERQAAATPHEVAIGADGATCTYAQLNTRANQVAHYLLSMGVASGDKVAVMLSPSIDMIVVLYGILKTGACFVPLAPQYPQQRVNAVLRNSKARLAVSDSSLRSMFSAFAHDVVCVDDIAGALAGYSAEQPAAAGAGELAYVLHTSGSTGTPKGIEIGHDGLVNMLVDLQRTYALTVDDRVLFHTPFTFDVFIQEVFWPLAYGARVVVMGDAHARTGKGIGDLVEREGVTLIQFVPAMLESLTEAREQGRIAALTSLRQVICGAAALYRGLAERFAGAFGCRLANHYGPTEVTVDACRFDCTQPYVGDAVPLGAPIGNAAVYILDAQLQVVPRGIVGEIHVASPGLARGYLNDREATARAFVEIEIDGAACRLYRTGDLGHCDSDGLIYFHGRRDMQFKIRGNRVELEEISSALRTHPDIAAAAIQYRESAGGAALVAYVEQKPANNQVTVPGSRAPLYSFTLEQRPELFAAVEALHAAMHPREWTAALARRFPACQLMLTDVAGTVVAAMACLPLRIDATLAAPGDAQSAWQQSSAQHDEGVAPNALYVCHVSTMASPPAPLPDREIVQQQYRLLAAALGLASVVVQGEEPCAALHTQRRTHLTRDSVRAWLRRSLPDYMIPDLVHFVTAVPLTDSGKIDVRNLPRIEAGALGDRQHASTALQVELAEIWQRLLKIPRVGVTDDFFMLGGQSLKAIEIVSEVNERYGVKIPLREFYMNPTIRHLESLLRPTACKDSTAGPG